MSPSRSGSARGFTLVEMLVVLGIIAVLVALLMPAVMYAVNRGRVTQMGMEISQLANAVEKYKQDMGDYPPNFRDYNAFIRHVRRCYPKVATADLNAFIAMVWPGYSLTSPPPVGTVPTVDEGESLVFWLAGTRNDPQYPFGLAGGGSSAFKRFYEFDERRWATPTDPTGDGDPFPSFRTKYAKDTFYIYIDSRSYDELTYFAGGPVTCAFAEINAGVSPPPAGDSRIVRPYANDAGTAMNPTSFQIICAGQDGNFGNDQDSSGAAATAVKGFPGGANYSPADRDNLTNFSGGKVLEDHLP